jgi:branched-chain amino acid transport system ATP-binding protein
VRYALIGPNGAGKTTLINLMTGMLRPDSGQIFLGDGENATEITSLRPDKRVHRGLARTFQINQLFPQLTPLEAVTLAILEREGSSKVWWRSLPAYGKAAEEAHGILASLNLKDLLNRQAKELAYGQQRLVEIALALATRPRLLLLDEPAAGIPAAGTEEVFAALAALPPEVAILFIEHDMDLVFRFAQRITVLVGGRILMEGSPDEVARDPRVREVYLGEAAHG